MHGQAFFYKYEFYDGLKKFFQDQDKIFKSTKDLTGDAVIVMDKSDDFDVYLKDGLAAQGRTSPRSDQQGADPMDDLMQNLLNNVANCEKLLASGQVKDFNRKESIQLMINQFNTQIKELEKSKLTQQESLFKRRYGASAAGQSVGSPAKGAIAGSMHGAESVRSPASSAKAGKKLLRKGESKKLTKNELIDNSLKEVFDFYARQHIQNNQGFQEMQEGMKKIDLGEFNGFLRDFKLNLPR